MPLTFFHLPREIRDEIYSYFCSTEPHAVGPLEDYAIVPSTAPLLTCQQIRTEMWPIYHSNLKKIVLQNRVCIEFESSEFSTRCAGWTRLEPNSYNIWVREGAHDTRFAAW